MTIKSITGLLVLLGTTIAACGDENTTIEKARNCPGQETVEVEVPVPTVPSGMSLELDCVKDGNTYICEGLVGEDSRGMFIRLVRVDGNDYTVTGEIYE